MAAVKFYESSHGGMTMFLVAGNDSYTAIQRVSDANVPAGINYYEKTVVILVKDKEKNAVRKELSKE
jgi:hypothetical protein